MTPLRAEPSALSVGISAWRTVEADLRRVLEMPGKPEVGVHSALAAPRPVILAVERAAARLDSELAWAMLITHAGKMCRRAQIPAQRCELAGLVLSVQSGAESI
jgi:hypothetical protein